MDEVPETDRIAKRVFSVVDVTACAKAVQNTLTPEEQVAFGKHMGKLINSMMQNMDAILKQQLDDSPEGRASQQSILMGHELTGKWVQSSKRTQWAAMCKCKRCPAWAIIGLDNLISGTAISTRCTG
jgi:hypothetical protein